MRVIKYPDGIISVYCSVSETKPSGTVQLEDGTTVPLRDGDRLFETDGDFWIYNKLTEAFIPR